MTGEPALHLGSEAEKNIPRPQQLHGMCPCVPNMKLLSGSSSRRVQTSALPAQSPHGWLPPQGSGELSPACGHRMCYSGQPPSGETTTSWTPCKLYDPTPGCASLPVGYLKLSHLITPKGQASSLPHGHSLGTRGAWQACVCVPSRFSRGQLFATLWTAAGQAAVFMGLSRHEYWSGLPCPPLRGSSRSRDPNHVSCGKTPGQLRRL